MRLLLTSLCLLFASSAAAQSADPGRTIYASRCAGCHGSNGGGGELGPSIVSRVPARTDEELTTVIRQGLPTAGMPASPGLSDAEVRDLISFLRTLRPREGSGPVRTKIALANGSSLEGLVLNQGHDDLQLLGDDRKIHLLRKSGDRYRAGDLTDRLAELQRADGRKPVQPADPDQQEQLSVGSCRSGSSAFQTLRRCR